MAQKIRRSSTSQPTYLDGMNCNMERYLLSVAVLPDIRNMQKLWAVHCFPSLAMLTDTAVRVTVLVRPHSTKMQRLQGATECACLQVRACVSNYVCSSSQTFGEFGRTFLWAFGLKALLSRYMLGKVYRKCCSLRKLRFPFL